MNEYEEKNKKFHYILIRITEESQTGLRFQ